MSEDTRTTSAQVIQQFSNFFESEFYEIADKYPWIKSDGFDSAKRQVAKTAKALSRYSGKPLTEELLREAAVEIGEIVAPSDKKSNSSRLLYDKEFRTISFDGKKHKINGEIMQRCFELIYRAWCTNSFVGFDMLRSDDCDSNECIRRRVSDLRAQLRKASMDKLANSLSFDQFVKGYRLKLDDVAEMSNEMDASTLKPLTEIASSVLIPESLYTWSVDGVRIAE